MEPKAAGFDFSIEHQKGKVNVVPDTLSREMCVDVDGINRVEIDLSAILN